MNSGFSGIKLSISELVNTLCGQNYILTSRERGICEEIVDNETYTFDGTDCVLMFKKARSIYGSFFDTW